MAEAAVISALTPRGERAVIRTPDRDVIDAIDADDRAGSPISIGANQRLTFDDP